MLQVAGIATVAEAGNDATPPDVCIVEGPSLAANDDSCHITPNPFSVSGVPTILLLPEPNNKQRRKALNAGYTIVIGTPASPRLLYRRIAHALQNSRRSKRLARAAQTLAITVPAEGKTQEQPALMADAPAN